MNPDFCNRNTFCRSWCLTCSHHIFSRSQSGCNTLAAGLVQVHATGGGEAYGCTGGVLSQVQTLIWLQMDQALLNNYECLHNHGSQGFFCLLHNSLIVERTDVTKNKLSKCSLIVILWLLCTMLKIRLQENLNRFLLLIKLIWGNVLITVVLIVMFSKCTLISVKYI